MENQASKVLTVTVRLACLFSMMGCSGNEYERVRVDDTDIFEAAEKGDIEAVGSWLRKDPGLANARWSNGVTPLWMAVTGGHREVVELLLDHKAEVNVKDGEDLTPLHWAASDGRQEIVRMLLARGAEVNARDRDGATPLRAAARAGHEGICRLLLSLGAKTAIFEQALMGRLEAVKQLLERDPSLVKATDPAGWTPLHFAAEAGSVNVCRLLLDRGAEVDATTGSLYYTSLLLAVGKGHIDVVVLLLERGANINAGGFEGMNALLQAGDDAAMVKFLLQKGADIGVRYCNMDYTILHEAARFGRDRVVGLLLEHDADPNVKANEGWSPLHVAGSEKVAEMLIESGSVVDARNDYGKTPLHHAASGYCSTCDPVKVCEVLLKHRADVNARDQEGHTPLKLALMQGQLEVAEFLRKNGGIE